VVSAETSKEYSVKEKDAAEIGFSEEFIPTYTTKCLKSRRPIPATWVGYEYVQKSRPFILQDEWTFQGELPVRRARFTTESAWYVEFRQLLDALSEQKRTKARPRLKPVWEVTNVPPIKHEQDMPRWDRSKAAWV